MTWLRVLGITIALAGFVDPVWTRAGNVTQPLSIIVIEAKQAPSSTASARLWAAADRLRSALHADYQLSVRPFARDSRGSVCPGQAGCVIISDGSIPSHLSAGAFVIGGLLIPSHGKDQVVVERIENRQPVNVNATGRLNVWLRGPDAERPVVIQVFDQEMLIGEREATLSAAPVAVDWVPLAEGPRRLRVVVGYRENGRQSAHDFADIGVAVSTETAPVLVYEPEPSWLGTFVRRSLEADPRFAVAAFTRFGPRVILAARAPGNLTRDLLEAQRVVIITAPNVLSANDVDLIERFVAVRGGTVLVLPDRRPEGPMTRLLPTIVGQRETAAQTVGSLKATELLLFDHSAEGTTALARVGDAAVVVSRAIGRGQVIVSGALDAWRFRDTSFARYWPALIADAAHAAGPNLRLSLERSAIRPGERTVATLEWRTIDPPPGQMTVSAEQSCDDGSVVPVRLWPAGQPRVFSGRIDGSAPARCVIRAAVTQPGQLEASASLVVAPDVAPVTPSPDAFSAAIRAHGGLVAMEGAEQSVVERVRAQLAVQRAVRETHPMRSPWWILPLAACLGGEWWLRRRRGLR